MHVACRPWANKANIINFLPHRMSTARSQVFTTAAGRCKNTKQVSSKWQEKKTKDKKTPCTLKAPSTERTKSEYNLKTAPSPFFPPPAPPFCMRTGTSGSRSNRCDAKCWHFYFMFLGFGFFWLFFWLKIRHEKYLPVIRRKRSPSFKEKNVKRKKKNTLSIRFLPLHVWKTTPRIIRIFTPPPPPPPPTPPS